MLRGEFRPGGVEREWCDPEVLRLLRRRSLARLRREVEPVDGAAYARFLLGWQGIGGERGGIERLTEVIAQLEGLPQPASVLEREILPARVPGYVPGCSMSSVRPARCAGSGRGASAAMTAGSPSTGRIAWHC